MRNEVAPQFKTKRANRKKNLLFHLLVGSLLLFVALSTTAPLLATAGVGLAHTFATIKSNLSPQKTPAINPLAPSFKEQLQSKLDSAIFEIKSTREIDQYSLEAISAQGVVAVFGNQTDLDKQVSSLQTLLSKSRIEARKIVKIDLRFNKTVVEYQ